MSFEEEKDELYWVIVNDPKLPPEELAKHSNATNKIPSATFYLWYTQGWMLKMYDAEKSTA